MNIIPILTTVAAIGASLLAIEGIDLASGGEFYMASIAKLAQETSITTAPAPAPVFQPPPSVAPMPAPPPPPPTETRMPPPPGGEPTATQLQPPPPPPTSTQPSPMPPPPPPPERPFIPMEPIKQPPQQDQPPQLIQPPQFQFQQQQQKQPQLPQQTPSQQPGQGERPEIQFMPWESSEEQEPQEFIDPREVQQVLREIKQIRNDIKRNFLKQIKKAGSETDLAQLNEILADLDRFQNAIANSSADVSEIRGAIEDFRDGQYWDRLNKIRARLEIPKQIQQIALSLKRLERTIQTKAVKNLGFNLERVGQTISEMKQNVEAVKGHYAAGNFEEAQEAMQEFHQGVNPGEIESTIHRIRDIKNMLKRVKDASIRAEVEKILQEVIDAFNNGEYRDARETLDEYADDLQNLISKYLITTGWGRGKINREESFSRIRNLEGLIKTKLQEKAGPSGTP